MGGQGSASTRAGQPRADEDHGEQGMRTGPSANDNNDQLAAGKKGAGATCEGTRSPESRRVEEEGDAGSDRGEEWVGRGGMGYCLQHLQGGTPWDTEVVGRREGCRVRLT